MTSFLDKLLRLRGPRVPPGLLLCSLEDVVHRYRPRPRYGILILARINYFSPPPVFGAQYYMSLHHVHVKVWKKNHPTAVMFATFLIGSFLIYQVGPFSSGY